MIRSNRPSRLFCGAALTVATLGGLAVGATTAAAASAPVLDRSAAHSTAAITYRDGAPVAALLRGAPTLTMHASAALPGRTATRTLSGSVPDDPGYRNQTAYLGRIGVPGAWSSPVLRARTARIRIAILDTGVAVAQPDLRGKIVGTYNAITGGRDVSDNIGHGTFVAGIAAAATDNRTGIAGVAWNARILAVKICSVNSCDIASEVRGIHWAVDHGAAVLNLSFGGAEQDPTEAAAIAWAQQRGVLVVAAAGNDAASRREYPAADPGVIAVGATDPITGRRAGFSNHGSWVTVAAPGTSVYSTTPWHSQMWGGGHAYGWGEGTSFASPIVTGEAALLKAADPSMSVAALRAIIAGTARGYRGLGLGAGQVDVAAALNRVRALRD